MGKEIHQPDITVPDFKDPLKYSKLAKVQEKWLRCVAPQLGLDGGKLVLGTVILQIIGDDENLIISHIHKVMDYS